MERGQVGGLENTVLLIARSQNFGWPDVRAILDDCGVHISGDVSKPDEAVSLAASFQPDVVLAGVKQPGIPIVNLVERLHAASPRSKIVVLGESESAEDLAALHNAGMHSYLRWQGLGPAQIRDCLQATVEAELVVVSPAAADEVFGLVDRQVNASGGETLLTEEESAIVRKLAKGKTQRQIGRDLGMSRRTVVRKLDAAKQRLRADSVYTLLLLAGRVGVDL